MTDPNPRIEAAAIFLAENAPARSGRAGKWADLDELQRGFWRNHAADAFFPNPPGNYGRLTLVEGHALLKLVTHQIGWEEVVEHLIDTMPESEASEQMRHALSDAIWILRMTTSAIERLSLIQAYKALYDAVERAEDEYSKLAAPDGTVAVSFKHLRAVLDETRDIVNIIAMGRKRWIESWCGSGPERGSSIHTVNEYGFHGEIIAYFGDGEGVHSAVGDIVLAHNAALIAEGIP